MKNEFDRHIVLDDHTDYCILNKKESIKRPGTGIINTILLYIQNEFVVLTYCNCISGYLREYEFVQTLVELKHKSKKIDKFDVYRDHLDNKDLIRRIKEGNLMSAKTSEINFIYSNVANYFCIASDLLFVDFIRSTNNIDDNYEKCKKYILENDLEYLEWDLNKLYELNKVKSGKYINSKTVDELNKFFKNKLKKKL